MKSLLRNIVCDSLTEMQIITYTQDPGKKGLRCHMVPERSLSTAELDGNQEMQDLPPPSPLPPSHTPPSPSQPTLSPSQNLLIRLLNP